MKESYEMYKARMQDLREGNKRDEDYSRWEISYYGLDPKTGFLPKGLSKEQEDEILDRIIKGE